MRNKRERIAAGCVMLTAAISFAAGLTNGFLYDDFPILKTRLGGVDHWSDVPPLLLESYWGALHAAALYRPLGLLWLGAERVLFGLHPFAYHAVGIVLYVFSAALLWHLVERLTPGWPALGAGLLFAVHPIHAEAVLTGYGQLEIAAAICALLSLEWFVSAARQNWHGGWLAASAGACLIGLGFKETAVVVPLLAIILELFWLPRRVVAVSVFVIPIGIYAAARYAVLGRLGGPSGAFAATSTAVARADVVIVALANSIRLTVLPWGQTVAHSEQRDELHVIPINELAWIGFAVLIVWLLAERIGWRKSLFAAVWFVVAWVPVSNLIPLEVLVSERALFLPVVGVALAIAWRMALFSPRVRWSGLAALLAIGIALSTRVCLRWHNDETLWETTVQDHPRSPYAQAALGLSLLNRAQREISMPARDAYLERAREHLHTAVTLNPRSPDGLLGLGIAAALTGDCASSKAYLNKMRPDPLLANQVAKARQFCPAE